MIAGFTKCGAGHGIDDLKVILSKMTSNQTGLTDLLSSR